MISGRQRHSNREECFKEAQDAKLKQPFSQPGKRIVNMTVGDATKLTFSKSTPYSEKVQRQGDIDADVQEQGYSSAKKDTAITALLGKPRDFENMVENRETIAKVESYGSSESKTCGNLSRIHEDRLGFTTQFLPRQAENTLVDMRSLPERPTLGSHTTRLSLRQVVGCSPAPTEVLTLAT